MRRWSALQWSRMIAIAALVLDGIRIVVSIVWRR